jgi:cell division transport system permease protein
MAGIGTGSLKRSKPNYIYSIIGVAIVLFIMGIMGWLFLNLHTISDNFKEDIRISIYLKLPTKIPLPISKNLFLANLMLKM